VESQVVQDLTVVQEMTDRLELQVNQVKAVQLDPMDLQETMVLLVQVAFQVKAVQLVLLV
jgi:hypothetical protein